MNPKECKRKRKEFGLSQKVLAEKIGSHQRVISRYEKRYEKSKNLVENLERFFLNLNQEEQYKSDTSLTYHRPTKEEVSKFQIRDEVIRPEGVSVGTLIRIENNYLVVSAKDLISTPQLYHPAYFKAKKSK